MSIFDPPKDHAQKTRDALTGSMKSKIKTLIGKCEYCGVKKPNNLLEVHHISEVATANGNSDKNTPGNLVVLDLEHHKLAHDGHISKTAIKAKISKRSEKTKTALRAILRDREKTNGDSSGPLGPASFKPFRPPVLKPYKQPKFNF